MVDCTVDTAVPTFRAYLCDLATPAIGLYHGYGRTWTRRWPSSAPSVRAAQGRLVFIAGSRDDSFRHHRRLHSDYTDGNAALLALPATVDLRDFPDESGDTFEADGRTLLAKLAQVGAKQVLAVDLTHPDVGVDVFRVIVPGMEGYMLETFTPGHRAHAWAAATADAPLLPPLSPRWKAAAAVTDAPSPSSSTSAPPCRSRTPAPSCRRPRSCRRRLSVGHPHRRRHPPPRGNLHHRRRIHAGTCPSGTRRSSTPSSAASPSTAPPAWVRCGSPRQRRSAPSASARSIRPSHPANSPTTTKSPSCTPPMTSATARSATPWSTSARRWPRPRRRRHRSAAARRSGGHCEGHLLPRAQLRPDARRRPQRRHGPRCPRGAAGVHRHLCGGPQAAGRHRAAGARPRPGHHRATGRGGHLVTPVPHAVRARPPGRAQRHRGTALGHRLVRGAAPAGFAQLSESALHAALVDVLGEVLHVEADEAAIAAELDRFRADRRLRTDEDLAAWQADNDLTDEEFADLLRRQAVRRKAALVADQPQVPGAHDRRGAGGAAAARQNPSTADAAAYRQQVLLAAHPTSSSPATTPAAGPGARAGAGDPLAPHRRAGPVGLRERFQDVSDVRYELVRSRLARRATAAALESPHRRLVRRARDGSRCRPLRTPAQRCRDSGQGGRPGGRAGQDQAGGCRRHRRRPMPWSRSASRAGCGWSATALPLARSRSSPPRGLSSGRARRVHRGLPATDPVRWARRPPGRATPSMVGLLASAAESAEAAEHTGAARAHAGGSGRRRLAGVGTPRSALAVLPRLPRLVGRRRAVGRRMGRRVRRSPHRPGPQRPRPGPGPSAAGRDRSPAAGPGRDLRPALPGAEQAPSAWLRIWHDSPVMLRVMAVAWRQWRTTTEELIARMGADLPQLVPGRLIAAVESDAGDRHCDGRGVAAVTFDDGSGCSTSRGPAGSSSRCATCWTSWTRPTRTCRRWAFACPS